MSDDTLFTRSPERMSADDAGLLVVDVQGKLIDLIEQHERIIWNIRRLLDGAILLGVPALATEQYPQGLGATLPELAQRLGRRFDKTSFSCAACSDICRELRASDRRKWLVCGIEAHVCVQQTVLDLLAEGISIYVAADAIGSRFKFDYEVALRRMESSGATITTTEAALFEWCEDSKSPQFKQISQLIRESAPA
ncbi:MAG: hydrolase [Pirellulales bacterium]|nr:hydrolase [Pirellulales bacterium]